MVKKSLFSIICIALLFIACLINSNDIKREPVKFFDFSDASMYEKFIYKIKNKSIYYVGIDYLKVDNDDFINYLERHSINDLKEKFNQSYVYDDGGSTLYYCDDDSVCDSRIKVMYCNTKNKNKDVFIASNEYNTIDKVCQ